MKCHKTIILIKKNYLIFLFNFLFNIFNFFFIVHYKNIQLKKSSLLKKNYNNIKIIIFKKYLKKNKRRLKYKKFKVNFRKKPFFKSFDFHFLHSYLLINRRILSKFFFKKILKKKKLNKFFKFISYYKASVFNHKCTFIFFLLLKLNFFLNDIIFLIKNNFIFVNNKNINNPFYIISLQDVINIIFSEKFICYFLIFRKKFKKIIRKLKKKNWKIKKFFKKNFKNVINIHYPNFIFKFLAYKNPIPLNIEYDFFLQQIFFFNLTKNKYYDFLISIYMPHLLKLLNWKRT